MTPMAQRIRAITYHRFRLTPVRSPLLGGSRLISFPQGTEMFHFPWFALITYEFSYKFLDYSKRVAPFGHLRIKAC
jgi:hypothetical protein